MQGVDGVVRREVGRYFAAQQFLTRLPCPGWTPYSPADLAASLGWFSLVGVPVGAAVGLVGAGLRSTVNTPFAAVLALAVGAAITGAFHEDGFADTCDSFGGYTPERRREIMRDSRVGTFGALGLIVLFVSKFVLMVDVLSRSSSWRLMLVAICAHCVSRAGTVLAVKFVPPVLDPSSKTKSYRVNTTRLLCALSIPALPLSVYVLGWNAALLWGIVILVVELARPFFQYLSDGVSGDGLGAINQFIEVATWAVAVRATLGR